MLTVGGHKVNNGRRVFQVGGEIGPTGIGAQLRITAEFKELLASLVQRRHCGIATAGNIKCTQVQRQPDEVITQRIGNKLINLVADLTRHAADNRTDGHIIRNTHTVDLIKCHRVEERSN